MKYLFALLLAFCGYVVEGQSLDASLKSVSDDLAQKVSKKHKPRLGLLDIVNQDGKRDAIVSYIQEQIEMNLINAADLEVLDRKHLTNILQENKLISDGLIDETTVNKAVSLFKVDGWVIGEVTNFGSQLKIKLKVLDVNTSQIYAASTSGLIDGSELERITDPKSCKYCAGTGTVKSKALCTTCNGTGGPRCPICGGSGQDFIANGLGRRAPCPNCAGKGKVECQVCQGTGQAITLNTCQKCNGTGKLL